jgi:metal-responsive CopG/Arc/MetJ family transcriptional regulator
MKHVYINIRVPAELAQALDRLAEAEAKRPGLNVTRSELIRRAINEDLAKRAPEEKKGGAK